MLLEIHHLFLGISCLTPTSEVMCQWFLRMRDSTMVLSSNSGFPCKSSFNCKYSEQYTQNTLLKQTHTHTHTHIYIYIYILYHYVVRRFATRTMQFPSLCKFQSWWEHNERFSLRPRHFPIIQEVGTVTSSVGFQGRANLGPGSSQSEIRYTLYPHRTAKKMGQVMINRLFFGFHIFRQLCLFHCLRAKTSPTYPFITWQKLNSSSAGSSWQKSIVHSTTWLVENGIPLINELW